MVTNDRFTVWIIVVKGFVIVNGDGTDIKEEVCGVWDCLSCEMDGNIGWT